jgi:phosphohistidine phosphatase
MVTISDLDCIVDTSTYSTLLVLMRHAHAGWARPGEKDFDRAIDQDGLDEVASIARRFFARHRLPEIILISPATRCKMTADAFLQHQPDEQAHRTTFQFCQRLYTDKVEAYIDQIQNAPRTQSLMMIGHNPMMEETLPSYLKSGTSGFGNGFAYPTAGLAILGFSDEILPGQGELLDFLTP